MTRIPALAVAAAALTLLLSACSAGAEPIPALPLGEGVVVSAGEGVEMSFAVDDVREGTLADLEAMGLQLSDSDDGKAAYFVTYSITLVDGDIADAESELLPVPTAEEWTLRGDGGYQPITTIMGSIDCTEDGTGTTGVGPDAPLIGCTAFFGSAGALPTGVEVDDLGAWETK